MEVVHTEAEKLRGAALGDLDLGRDGIEAASVGYGRNLLVHYRDAKGWLSQLIHSDDAPLHHLAVGELDAGSPGLELVTCGHSGRLIVAGVSYGVSGLATTPGDN